MFDFIDPVRKDPPPQCPLKINERVSIHTKVIRDVTCTIEDLVFVLLPKYLSSLPLIRTTRSDPHHPDRPLLSWFCKTGTQSEDRCRGVQIPLLLETPSWGSQLRSQDRERTGLTLDPVPGTQESEPRGRHSTPRVGRDVSGGSPGLVGVSTVPQD